jgi:phage-related protein
MDRHEKDLVWLRERVRTPPFSPEARVEAGVLLRRLQQGERIAMPHSRPMPAIGPGCHELRVQDRSVTWRIIHAVREDAVIVLAVFSKKTTQTPSTVIAICRQRLKAYDSLA